MPVCFHFPDHIDDICPRIFLTERPALQPTLTDILPVLILSIGYIGCASVPLPSSVITVPLLPSSQACRKLRSLILLEVFLLVPPPTTTTLHASQLLCPLCCSHWSEGDRLTRAGQRSGNAAERSYVKESMGALMMLQLS